MSVKNQGYAPDPAIGRVRIRAGAIGVLRERAFIAALVNVNGRPVVTAALQQNRFIVYETRITSTNCTHRKGNVVRLGAWRFRLAYSGASHSSSSAPMSYARETSVPRGSVLRPCAAFGNSPAFVVSILSEPPARNSAIAAVSSLPV